jgi:Transcription activator MBF2
LFPIVGDAILKIGHHIEKSANGELEDIDMAITYPARGQSPKQFTYFEVKIDQTSQKYRVTIVDGGIHQHHVKIRIQSQATMFQNLTVLIYGK